MKVVRIHDYGGPEAMVFEEVPDPQPGRGEIVVAVEAAGVNPADYKFRNGSLAAYFPKPMPLVLGMDVAGRVLALGVGVTDFKTGDRVFGMMPMGGNGGYAERTFGPAVWFTATPEGMDSITAAALPTPASTAIQQIEDDLDVQPGQKLIVTGATGACGRVLCYAAKRRGGHVTAAVREKYRDQVRHADEVLILDGSAAPGTASYDYIADTVGGAVAHGLLPMLKAGGVLSTIATDPIGHPSGLDVVVRHFGVLVDAGRLAQFAHEMAAGATEPPAITVMKLSEAPEAHRRLEAGGGGKIVLI